MSMRMLDLCSGLGGVGRVFRQRGWQVTTVDIDPKCEPDIVADVRQWSWRGQPVDFVWASPPCDEFSRSFMPWCGPADDPDMSIALGCWRVIQECSPRYWVLENVLGAVRWFRPFFGDYRQHIGPYYLWGFHPILGRVRMSRRRKDSMSSAWAAVRAKIPSELSNRMAEQVERQLSF